MDEKEVKLEDGKLKKDTGVSAYRDELRLS